MRIPGQADRPRVRRSAKKFAARAPWQLYQLDINNPLIANNPAGAVAHHSPDSRRVWLSIPPKEEMARIQAGEEIAVPLMDDDQAHITAHFNQLALLQGDEQPNPEVVKRLSRHYLEHVRQLQQKKLIQALTQNVTESLPALQQQLGPISQFEQLTPVIALDNPDSNRFDHFGKVVEGGTHTQVFIISYSDLRANL